MAFFKGSNCNNIPLFFAWGYFGSLLAQCFHQLKRDWLKTVPVAKTSQRSSETGFMTRKQVWLYSVNNYLLPDNLKQQQQMPIVQIVNIWVLNIKGTATATTFRPENAQWSDLVLSKDK